MHDSSRYDGIGTGNMPGQMTKADVDLYNKRMQLEHAVQQRAAWQRANPAKQDKPVQLGGYKYKSNRRK